MSMSISARVECARLPRGREQHQFLRRRPLGVPERASSSLRHRLPDAGQRSRSRGHRPGRLGALANGGSQRGSRRRGVSRGGDDTAGDQRPAVGSFTARNLRRDMAGRTGRHDRPWNERGTKRSARAGCPGLARKAVAHGAGGLRPSRSVRLFVPGHRERSPARGGQRASSGESRPAARRQRSTEARKLDRTQTCSRIFRCGGPNMVTSPVSWGPCAREVVVRRNGGRSQSAEGISWTPRPSGTSAPRREQTCPRRLFAKPCVGAWPGAARRTPCRRHHLTIGRGVSGCFQNRSIVSSTSRRWKPALGHSAATVAMNVRGRPNLRSPRDTSIQSARRKDSASDWGCAREGVTLW